MKTRSWRLLWRFWRFIRIAAPITSAYSRLSKRAKVERWDDEKLDQHRQVLHNKYAAHRSAPFCACLHFLCARFAPQVLPFALKMGGIYIKIAQILSSGPLLPKQYVKALESCQDGVPPKPTSVIRQQISSAFQRDCGEIFASIDERPLGAASIGQVHRAVLLDGREVAIKVHSVPHKETGEDGVAARHNSMCTHSKLPHHAPLVLSGAVSRGQ